MKKFATMFLAVILFTACDWKKGAEGDQVDSAALSETAGPIS